MRKFYFIYLFITFNLYRLDAQPLYFPPLTGSTWDTISPQSLNWCQSRIDSLYNYLQSKNSKSFILLKDGKIVLEKYFGTYTSDSLFYWASASKSLASFITGIAQQKGYININNLVNQYITPGWTSETPVKENLITVKNLISMTSGLDDNMPPPCSNDDTAKACLVYKADAGTRWGYQTGAYKKVQDVVSTAVGLNYNLITNNWIKIKTGMAGLWIDQTYYSKARDMARFGLTILNRGAWNIDTLLKDPSYFNAMINTSQTFNPSYGYLWWLNGKSGYMNPGLQLLINGPLIPNAAGDMFCALGKNDQKIYVIPSTGVVVVRQGNSAEGVTFALSDFDNTLWDYINKLNCTTVSIKTQINYETAAVYPNPSSELIRIESSLGIKSVVFENAFGEVLPANLAGNTVNISDMKKGIYLMHIILINDLSVNKKIIIN